MTDSGYIYIPNWKDFQHYRDQTSPVWIKVYKRLLSNDAYLRLSLADRGLLLNLWLLSSLDGEGRVSADRTLLARRLNVRRVSLEPLIQAGFIQVRSRKRLDKSYRRSSPEAEAEAEKKDISAERARANGHNGDGSAIYKIDPERTDALQRLVDAIGHDGDKNTPTTIHRKVAQYGLSTADLRLAAERVTTVRCADRARYAVGILNDIGKAKETA